MKTSIFAILVMTVIAYGSAKSQEKTADPSLPVEDSIKALAAKYPAKTINFLLSRIQANLPKGWHASYEKEYSLLEISRDEALLATKTGINGSGSEKPERTEFAFAFRVKPLVSPAEYRRLATENARIQEDLNTLYEDLKKRGLQRRFDSFGWKTEEDKRDVARYDVLKRSRHRLPDYYFEDISLEWIYGRLNNSLWGPDIYIEDKRIREECTQTQKKLLSLISKYEGA